MTNQLNCFKKEIKPNSVAYTVPEFQYTSCDNTDPIFESKPCSSRIETTWTKRTTGYVPMIPKNSKKFIDTNSVITAKCYMINDERFAVEISSFLSTAINIFYTLNSQLHEPNTNIWSFHLRDYNILMKKLLELNSNLAIIQIPASVIRLFKKSFYSIDYIPSLIIIDEALRHKLMLFQRDGIRYGILKKGRCIIADELGKTMQALGIACYFQSRWPLLIIAPSIILHQWFEAISQYLPSIPAHSIQVFVNFKDFIDDVQVVIVSYNMLAKSKELFKKRDFQFVILDKSHVIKNKNTIRFKAVQDIISNSRHVVLLSGKLDLFLPKELYNQMNLVVPNFMEYDEYRIRYCKKKEIYGCNLYRSSTMQELQLLKSLCIIKRLKVDLLNQLPSKRRKVIILNAVLMKGNKKVRKNISEEMNRKISSDLPYHNVLIRYYNQSSFVRLKAVCDYLTNLLLCKKKCLILAHHKHTRDAILSLIISMGIEFVQIDETYSSSKRRIMIDRFKNYETILAAVVSINAANADIIPVSQLVIFAELFWNPEILYQIENRVERIKDTSVTIQYLVVKETVDDYLWLLFKKMINTVGDFHLDQNNSTDEVEITD